jgi:hypothetical protein
MTDSHGGHILGPVPPSDEVKDPVNGVPLELQEAFKTLQNLERGNQRLEQQYIQRGGQINSIVILMMRINILYDKVFGPVQLSGARIELETKIAEQIRSDLNIALLRQ